MADRRGDYSPTKLYLTGQRMTAGYTPADAVADYMWLHPDADERAVQAEILLCADLRNADTKPPPTGGVNGQNGPAAMSLEEQIDALVERFLDEVTPLATDPHFKEALAQVVLRDVTWGLYHRLDISRHELSDGLNVLATVILEDGEGEDVASSLPEPERAPGISELATIASMLSPKGG
jgi:hypothetical protein